MEDSAFSDEFCHFLQASVTSVDAAELLLALAEQPERWWSAAELAELMRPRARLSEGDVARYLERFRATGLAAVGPDKRAQYRPANESLAGYVRMLAQAYEERPVTLFRVIYALRDLTIQSFADAFRLKRN